MISNGEPTVEAPRSKRWPLAGREWHRLRGGSSETGQPPSGEAVLGQAPGRSEALVNITSIIRLNEYRPQNTGCGFVRELWTPGSGRPVAGFESFVWNRQLRPVGAPDAARFRGHRRLKPPRKTSAAHPAVSSSSGSGIPSSTIVAGRHRRAAVSAIEPDLSVDTLLEQRPGHSPVPATDDEADPLRPQERQRDLRPSASRSAIRRTPSSRT